MLFSCHEQGGDGTWKIPYSADDTGCHALVQVFQYFGGVPRRVIFDNGKVAVKDGFGAHARKQAGYAALAAHYGFEAVFCNPASGNEKGLVEGLVGYSRRNTCVPVPRVDFEVTPHQLRHTYITNLIHASVDPKTVQYLAGHESSKITMDIYAKVKYNRPDEIVRAMGTAFAQWESAV